MLVDNQPQASRFQIKVLDKMECKGLLEILAQVRH